MKSLQEWLKAVCTERLVISALHICWVIMKPLDLIPSATCRQQDRLETSAALNLKCNTKMVYRHILGMQFNRLNLKKIKCSFYTPLFPLILSPKAMGYWGQQLCSIVFFPSCLAIGPARRSLAVIRWCVLLTSVPKLAYNQWRVTQIIIIRSHRFESVSRLAAAGWQQHSERAVLS